MHLDAQPTSFEALLAEYYPNDKQETEQVQQSHRTRMANEVRIVYGLDVDLVKNTTFYKVPFEQVLELVSKRSVLLKNGFAFVPESERVLLVMNAFKEALMKGLEETARALPRMEEDDRFDFPNDPISHRIVLRAHPNL